MEPLLSITDVAKILNLTVRRVHCLCREGKLAYVSHSPRRRDFLPEHVEAYVRSRTITPPPKAVDIDRRKVLPWKPQPTVSEKSQKGSVTKALKEEMAQW